MAKILLVLYNDPIDGYPPKYARDNIPVLDGYPDGQKLPSPDNIDFTPGQLLGCDLVSLGYVSF
jgi:formate dehydrogenase